MHGSARLCVALRACNRNVEGMALAAIWGRSANRVVIWLTASQA